MFTTTIIVIAVLILIFIYASIRVLREYERGVVFTLGRYIPAPRAPACFCWCRSSSRWCASICVSWSTKSRRRT